MNAFVQAIKNLQTEGRTFNNAKTFNTSGDPVLDLFNAAGNRSVDLSSQFDIAYSVDPKLAFRVALWSRDIRGGAGERQTFRNFLLHFEKHYKDELIKILPKIPELGRWDDLLIFVDPMIKNKAFEVYQKGLFPESAKDAGTVGLAAKWAPRRGHVADELRRFLKLNWRTYRKTITVLSKTVEQLMSANRWNEIIFDHVPSVASARYQKAFNKHCPEAYQAYRNGLKKVKPDGTTERKVNASAVYPYDIVKSIRNGGDYVVASAQWDALPNYLGDDKILPLIDVSGSMTMWSYYGQRNTPKTNVTPMDIAISLGLYVADKQTGPFKDTFLTFESAPKLQVLSGDLVSKIRQAERAPWGGSTNIQFAFDKILDTARASNASEEDMPKVLLILSDMEFDQCIQKNSERQEITNYEYLQRRYEESGYTLPKVVFWKINGRVDNVPVKHTEQGTAIVSGFSPALFKTLLKGDIESFTPYNVMVNVLNNPRYDVEGVTI